MPPHLLHVFSTFAVGGPQVRTAAIINALGDEFRHTILPIDGRREALAKISVPVTCVAPPPSRHPLVRPLQLRRILQAQRPKLVLTYNWGAIEAVLAARTLSIPVIHAEDGFGPDEAGRLRARRVWARRLLLRGVPVIVPSRTLEQIALADYRLSRARVQYIPNGIDLERFHAGRAPSVRASLGASGEEIVFGAIGGLRPEKNLAFLLRAFREAAIPNSRLVLVGEGSCRRDLESLAVQLGIESKVRFAGATEETAEHYRAFDIFVMSSLTEQMPLALLEAMASGLPAICADAGDTAVLLGSAEPPEVVRRGDLAGYVQALRTLAQDQGLRRRLGQKNRERCEAEYGLQNMVRRYRALYLEAITGSG
jgi:glycosyltransferase involved in cell wall biosynthesis